ncbi:nucleotide exchange factor SIL1 isoform X1 [Schistocerca nitens]|uniref:nucleotide exchange factor SIL1 isoform X1 n=1 Tax=Schistocerca nitens TaxID=7011 RepID=UPI00211975DF|nr:nucleotide exchange factor SIL1 isoform X1 [Schistocerca nitens]
MRLCVVFAVLFFVEAVVGQFATVRRKSGVVKDDEEDDVFVATEEWQTVKKGQSVPSGLHVRLNLETGETEAKLLDPSERPGATAVAPVYDEAAKDENSDITENKERIRESILNIESVEDSITTEEDIERVRKRFRSYDELKKKFEELNLNIKTDLELLNELLAKFRASELKEDEGEDELIAILTDLEYMVHQVDNAKEFVQAGGILEILPLLNATSPQLRSVAAHLLGSAAQSNPRVQIALLEAGALTALVRAVALDTDPTVRSRALFALSCLIRNFPIAQAQFVTEGGLSGLAELFAGGDSHDKLKLQLKVATLLQDLLQERTDALMAEDKQREERIRQYEQAGLEAHLSEQGWCRRVVQLLASQAQVPAEGFNKVRRDDFSSAVSQEVPVLTHHDAVEKAAGAVLALARGPCQKEYRGNSRLISVINELRVWYSELASRETQPDGQYFSGLFELFDQLSIEVGIKTGTKDEL